MGFKKGREIFESTRNVVDLKFEDKLKPLLLPNVSSYFLRLPIWNLEVP